MHSTRMALAQNWRNNKRKSSVEKRNSTKGDMWYTCSSSNRSLRKKRITCTGFSAINRPTLQLHQGRTKKVNFRFFYSFLIHHIHYYNSYDKSRQYSYSLDHHFVIKVLIFSIFRMHSKNYEFQKFSKCLKIRKKSITQRAPCAGIVRAGQRG